MSNKGSVLGVKSPNGNKLAILKALNQPGFISGQALGEQLGISRAAVSKHIQSLQEMGLDIFKVTGKGYSLNNRAGLLNQSHIKRHGIQLGADMANVEVHPIIDSTNSELMRRIQAKTALNSGTVIVAEMQQAGRGRRGRVWQSPFGANLYYSYFWRLEDGIQAAMGVSIAVGLAVYDTIKALYDIKIELKWPNDIYLNKQKLAGVLVELDGQPQGPCQLVIGIGINVQMPQSVSEQIDQAWTDLSQHTQQLDKNKLVAALTYHLEQRLARYSETGLQLMYEQWNELNAFAGEYVELNTGHRSWRGICEGIDPQVLS